MTQIYLGNPPENQKQHIIKSWLASRPIFWVVDENYDETGLRIRDAWFEDGGSPGLSGDITVPAEISGQPVVCLYADFRGDGSSREPAITSLKLPASVTQIDDTDYGLPSTLTAIYLEGPMPSYFSYHLSEDYPLLPPTCTVYVKRQHADSFNCQIPGTWNYDAGGTGMHCQIDFSD